MKYDFDSLRESKRLGREVAPREREDKMGYLNLKELYDLCEHYVYLDSQGEIGRSDISPKIKVRGKEVTPKEFGRNRYNRGSGDPSRPARINLFIAIARLKYRPFSAGDIDAEQIAEDLELANKMLYSKNDPNDNYEIHSGVRRRIAKQIQSVAYKTARIAEKRGTLNEETLAKLEKIVKTTDEEINPSRMKGIAHAFAWLLALGGIIFGASVFSSEITGFSIINESSSAPIKEGIATISLVLASIAGSYLFFKRK